MARPDETRLGKFEIVRGVDAGAYLETLLVSAVVSLLAIRTLLGLTGFPQLGGGGLHIAHMLWGGLLMLAALVVVLTFLGKAARHAAALLGGLGFGTFIDELGKFITSDNDYFYRPTIAIIYLIFIGLFFLFRAIERQREHTRREMLVNSADSLVDLLLDRASPKERARTLLLLENSGDRGPLAATLRGAVEAAEVADLEGASLPYRVGGALRHAYGRLVAWRWFHRAIVLVLVVRAAVYLASGAFLMVTIPYSRTELGARDLILTLAVLVPTYVASLFAAVGAFRLRRSRLDAFRWLKRSLLVSILVVQVFVFYQDELGALEGLFFDLVLLLGVNYVLRQETARAETRAVRPAPEVAVAAAERVPPGLDGSTGRVARK